MSMLLISKVPSSSGRRLAHGSLVHEKVDRNKGIRLTLCELIRHSKAPVVSGGTPDVRDPSHISEIDQIQPAVEYEPPRLPVEWHIIGIARRSERKAVEEEESEDDQDADQNAPP